MTGDKYPIWIEAGLGSVIDRGEGERPVVGLHIKQQTAFERSHPPEQDAVPGRSGGLRFSPWLPARLNEARREGKPVGQSLAE